MSYIEIIKNIATIVGCIISCITLAGIIIKPLRTKIFNKIISITNSDQIKIQEKKLAEEDIKINKLTKICEENVKSTRELKQIIFDNESDRLRGELFNCGNRCRRGIPLSLEEYRFIQSEWQKYNGKLHCNSIGEDEYRFIVKYYDSQSEIERK